MSDVVIVAILSLIGTIVGSLGGIVVSNRLTSYRLDKLEKSVEENNKLVNRVYNLEAHNKLQDQRITNVEDETQRLISDMQAISRKGA